MKWARISTPAMASVAESGPVQVTVTGVVLPPCTANSGTVSTWPTDEPRSLARRRSCSIMAAEGLM